MSASPHETSGFTIRLATLDDVPILKPLIAASVRVLQAPEYPVEQREAALGTVFGVDRQLIRDHTYFVAEGAGIVVGCGGWSRRRTCSAAISVATGKMPCSMYRATRHAFAHSLCVPAMNAAGSAA